MKTLFFTVILTCSFAFARVSTYQTIVVSPVESYIQKKQVEFSQVDSGSDYSVQWKRRHKRRKRMNKRPQRGR